jgi:hypothetical protein
MSGAALDTKLQALLVHALLMDSISRRLLLCGGIGSGILTAGPRREKTEDIYRFATREWDIRVTIEFHDRYSSAAFRFKDRLTDHRFCLSGEGKEDSHCLTDFVGSIAIARYQIRPRGQRRLLFVVREKVRTIDADNRLPDRPPFERTLEPSQGIVSDIQAFGYQATTFSKGNESEPVSKEPWSLLRQDLFFADQSAPFLMVHWKHTLSAIRVLDMIPGEETFLVEQET